VENERNEAYCIYRVRAGGGKLEKFFYDFPAQCVDLWYNLTIFVSGGCALERKTGMK